MVWLVVDYGECAVQLFHKYQAHHLMREGHLGERNFLVGFLIYLIVKPVRTSYYKGDVLVLQRDFFGDIVGELHRGELLAMLV